MAIEKQIRIDRHAYVRYCERVEPIGWQELEHMLQQQLADGINIQDGYLRTGDIWWRAEVTDDEVIIHTCYGRTHIDIPQAVKWAKRYRDRLRLGSYAD